MAKRRGSGRSAAPNRSPQVAPRFTATTKRRPQRRADPLPARLSSPQQRANATILRASKAAAVPPLNTRNAGPNRVSRVFEPPNNVNLKNSRISSVRLGFAEPDRQRQRALQDLKDAPSSTIQDIRNAFICAGRSAKKEVLHALGIAGKKGITKGKKVKSPSKVRC